MSHSSGAEVFYNSGAATVKAPSPPRLDLDPGPGFGPVSVEASSAAEVERL